MKTFVDALPITLRFEGGYSNHPSDPGGATMKGVTQRVYDNWRLSKSLPVRDVRLIEEHELQDIYMTGYWAPGKCAQMPWPVSLCHFDACVNHGIYGAAKILQRALGVPADGKIGPQTLGALSTIPTDLLVGRMLFERLDYYEKITLANRKLAAFLLAWLSRVNALRDIARLDMPTIS